MLSRADDADVVVMAAAVADFRPVHAADSKIKKAGGLPEVVLEPTADILAALGAQRRPGQIIVGFAAETDDLRANAAEKLAPQGHRPHRGQRCLRPGVGFEHDTNAVVHPRRRRLGHRGPAHRQAGDRPCHPRRSLDNKEQFVTRQWTFTSESVTEGHPDKMADQISDSILDAILAEDPMARVACETMVTTGLAIVAGEITTTAYVEIPKIVRETINRIGYDRESVGFDGNTCGVITSIDPQSPDIAQGVDTAMETRTGVSGEDILNAQGAGDQGMMFGYAVQRDRRPHAAADLAGPPPGPPPGRGPQGRASSRTSAPTGRPRSPSTTRATRRRGSPRCSSPPSTSPASTPRR